MQYSQSPDTVVHPFTGNRMHQDTAAVTSQITAKDVNQLIWSLMEVIKDQGIGAAAFDPATPDTFQRVLQAIKKLVDTRSAAPTIIDRSTVASVPLLLDRFDVIHKYRADRTLYPVGGTIVIGTQMVEGGIYQVYVNAADAAAFSNSDIALRPNLTSYANQFSTNMVHMGDPAANSTAFAGRLGVASPSPSVNNSFFVFDTFNGGSGSEAAVEMTLFPNKASYYKKILVRSGDTAGVMNGVGVWYNTTTAWNTVGGLSLTTNASAGSAPYFVDVFVRRIG